MSDLRQIHETSLARGTVIAPPDAIKIQEAFYANLTVLDTKASALMAFDGILVAVATFTLQDGGVLEGRQLPLLIIIMTLVAAALCLFVALMSYRFLGKVKMVPGTPPRLDYSEELAALHRAVDFRTVLYWIAWGLSLLAIVLFLVLFILTLMGYPIEANP